jgi:cardiolipin synthase
VDRVWTIPNAISAARLAGVPVFLWLVLGPRTPTADYWAVALRELVVGAALAVLKRRVGFGTLHVSLVGKTATLCLLYAFPLLFLGDHPGWGGTLARVIGWAFAIWGTALYWWAAMLYLAQVRSLVGDRRVHT